MGGELRGPDVGAGAGAAADGLLAGWATKLAR